MNATVRRLSPGRNHRRGILVDSGVFLAGEAAIFYERAVSSAKRLLLHATEFHFRTIVD